VHDARRSDGHQEGLPPFVHERRAVLTAAERLRATPPRSWLFVPALRAPEWLPKAFSVGADAVIVDLEDATAPAERESARDVVRALQIGSRERPAVFVRVNATRADLDPDISAAVASGADGIVLPKVELPEDVHRVVGLLIDAEAHARRGEQLAIVPMIETPRAVLRALDIADADARVAGLAFGAGDFATLAGLARSREGTEITLARGLVALAASAAGIGAFDTPFLEIADLAGLRSEAMEAARVGFSGKLVIHPTHVASVNESFTPTASQVAEARELLDAFESALAKGTGATRYKGRMIDKPDAAHAKRVLSRAQALREVDRAEPGR
jgi:citrate lyase subunit beta/citryl-CoA lyase